MEAPPGYSLHHDDEEHRLETATLEWLYEEEEEEDQDLKLALQLQREEDARALEAGLGRQGKHRPLSVDFWIHMPTGFARRAGI